MHVAVIEGVEDPVLEVRARVGFHHGIPLLGGEVRQVHAEHVGFDTRADQCDLRGQELRNARGGVQGNGQPRVVGALGGGTVIEQELFDRVRTVHLEAQRGIHVPLGQSHVMEHGTGVEQLVIHGLVAHPALEGAEEEHATGVVVQQVVLGVTDVLGDLAGQFGTGNGDAGNGVSHDEAPYWLVPHHSLTLIRAGGR